MAWLRRRRVVYEREPVVRERRAGILGSIVSFFAELVGAIVSVILWIVVLVIIAIVLIWLL
jgi:hypothetical protein